MSEILVNSHYSIKLFVNIMTISPYMSKLLYVIDKIVISIDFPNILEVPSLTAWAYSFLLNCCI